MPEIGIQYFTYDALNRRSSLKDEVGQVWYFDYDAVSNLFVQRNPLGAFTYWEYDADQRKVSQKDPLGRAWYWTYDAVGNVTSLKDGLTQVTYYQHDSVNLRHRIDYPDTTQHYFEFDIARQLTAFSDPSGRTLEGYDNLGRVTHRLNPGGQNLYYEYDGVGNRTNLKDPDGVSTYYAYDAANRLTIVGSSSYGVGYGTQPYGVSPYGGDSGAKLAGWYEYDLADERTLEGRANGTVTYHGYDAAGRTSLIQHRKSDGTLIERYDYTRDEAGNITLQIRGSDSMRTYWNYDQANRITKEAWRTSGGSNIYGFNYAYDEAGNRLSKANVVAATAVYWEYDLGDQMTVQKSGSPVTVYFTYSANGNLSVEHDVDPSAGRTYYDYEPRNLLTRVDFPGALATNYFYYNAPGERIRKDDSTGGKKYTWDGLIPIVEKNLSNTTTQRMVKGYTPVQGIGDYLLQDVSGTVIYPHKNQVGTTVRHTDDSQAVVNTYEYDAWGVPIATTQGTAQQYRFNGRELDPDGIAYNSPTMRYCMAYRTYAPTYAGFLQVDPLAAIVALSPPRYSFAASLPTYFVDPLGLFSVTSDSLQDNKNPTDAYCQASKEDPGNKWLKCVCENVSPNIWKLILALVAESLRKSLQGDSESSKILGQKAAWFRCMSGCMSEVWQVFHKKWKGKDLTDDEKKIPTDTWDEVCKNCKGEKIRTADCCIEQIRGEMKQFEKCKDKCGKYDMAKWGQPAGDMQKEMTGKVWIDFNNYDERVGYGKQLCCDEKLKDGQQPGGY